MAPRHIRNRVLELEQLRAASEPGFLERSRRASASVAVVLRPASERWTRGRSRGSALAGYVARCSPNFFVLTLDFRPSLRPQAVNRAGYRATLNYLQVFSESS